MEALRLSENVYVRPVNSYGQVKFQRIKEDGSGRSVYFPAEWIATIIQQSQGIVNMEDNCHYKSWHVDVSEHLGVDYINMNYNDKTGDRIGYVLNITSNCIR